MANTLPEHSLRFWWPNAAAGLLLPFATVQLHRWLPLWAAFFLAFAVLFSAAGAVVLRRYPASERSYGRLTSGALVGAAIGAAFTYYFPWA